MRSRRTFKILIVVAASGVLSSPAASAVAAEVDLTGELGGGSCYSYRQAEKKLARLTNEARRSRSIAAMRLDPELSFVARFHTKKMVRKDRLFHQTSEQFNRRVTNWNAIAENVGRASTIRANHRNWMSSSTHSANILNPIYNHVGVGVVSHGGHKWATVIFEAATDPGTTLQMPSC